MHISNYLYKNLITLGLIISLYTLYRMYKSSWVGMDSTYPLYPFTLSPYYFLYDLSKRKTKTDVFELIVLLTTIILGISLLWYPINYHLGHFSAFPLLIVPIIQFILIFVFIKPFIR